MRRLALQFRMYRIKIVGLYEIDSNPNYTDNHTQKNPFTQGASLGRGVPQCSAMNKLFHRHWHWPILTNDVEKLY